MSNINELATAYAKSKSSGELSTNKKIYEAVLYGHSLKDAPKGDDQVGQPIPEHVFIPGNAGKPYVVAPEQPVLQATAAADGAAETPVPANTPPKNMAWDVPHDTTLPHSGQAIDKPTEVQTDIKADFPLYGEGEKPVEQAQENKDKKEPVVEGITSDGSTIKAPTQEAAVKDVKKKDAKTSDKKTVPDKNK